MKGSIKRYLLGKKRRLSLVLTNSVHLNLLYVSILFSFQVSETTNNWDIRPRQYPSGDISALKQPNSLKSDDISALKQPNKWRPLGVKQPNKW